MLKAEINPRADYALREKSAADPPVQRVRIIEHIRGNKWKAEWVDPNPGLIDYVESGNLICGWKDHKAFLEEKATARAFRNITKEVENDYGSPPDKPVHQFSDGVEDE